MAKSYIEISTEAELVELWQNSTAPLNWSILGAGSNLVLSEEISGLVVRILKLGKSVLHEDFTSWQIESYAGENWHDFVMWSLAQGVSGFENLSLIPGTVGASPIQNIGAYGVEVQELIQSVTCFDLETGKFTELSNAQCEFSYRDSIFKGKAFGKYLVWKVTFISKKNQPLQLSYGDVRQQVEASTKNPTARDVANAVIKIRQTKLPDPAVIGNAGSFFKNPIVERSFYNKLKADHPNAVGYPYGEDQYKLAAGWLIEHSGWKGKSLGPVSMFEKQALVLVNLGGATATDVWNLAKAVTESVFAKYGVLLEPEPIRW